MFEFLSLTFMQRALLGGELIAVVAGIVGPILLFRKMSFTSVGISHGAFAGIALGILIGVSPMWAAIAFAMGIGLLIGFVSKTGKISEDATIGTFFAFFMALGIFLIDISKGYHVDVMGYLFGNLLAISSSDVYFAAIVLLITVFWYLFRGRATVYSTFDEDFSRIVGIPVDVDYYFFMLVVSLVTIIAVMFVGVVLASSIMIAPSAASKMLSKKFSNVVLFSILFGMVAVFGGIAFSFYTNIPSGPSVVFFITAIFAISLGIKWSRNFVKS